MIVNFRANQKQIEKKINIINPAKVGMKLFCNYHFQVEDSLQNFEEGNQDFEHEGDHLQELILVISSLYNYRGYRRNTFYREKVRT